MIIKKNLVREDCFFQRKLNKRQCAVLEKHEVKIQKLWVLFKARVKS